MSLSSVSSGQREGRRRSVSVKAEYTLHLQSEHIFKK